MTAPPKMPPPPAVAPRTQPRATGAAFSMPEKSVRGHTIVINAVEGFGKTSLIANAPNSVIVMAPGETGYTTLYNAGLVGERPVASPGSWAELLATLDGIPSGTRYLGLDAMSGFERLCHEFVCERDFRGVWSEKGFNAFQRGYDTSIAEWLMLLKKLETVRDRGTHVILLSHSKVEIFSNPSGSDFSRYVADCHKKTWSVTHKWADAVLFGTFHSVIETKEVYGPEVLRKGKGIGGVDRVLYTVRRDAWDAKNRFGLEEVIDIPNDPQQAWPAFAAAVFKE